MTKDILACALTKHGVNNWFYHDKKNKLSVMLLPPGKLGLQASEYKSWTCDDGLTIISDLDINLSKVIKDIRQYVNKNRSYVSNSVSLVASLEAISYKNDRLTKQEIKKPAIQKIKDYGFGVDDDWICWKSYIPIKIVIYKNYFCYVDDEKLRSLGYGITSFKVVNDENLHAGVYCCGLHPNVSSNHKLCAEAGTRYLDMSLESLLIIKGLLGYINLNNPYDSNKHMPILLPLIKDFLP